MRIKIISLTLGLLLFSSIMPEYSYGANVTGTPYSVNMKASVGRYYFSASGIISPFASLVLTTHGNFLASTVADLKGNFQFQPSLVNDGFDSYCIEATDIRRIGTSYTCFKSDPPKANIEKDGLFLAPTVGLSGRKITPNSSIFSSGYSMPNSTVTINLGNGLWITAKADEGGYYKSEIKEIPPGKYELYAGAYYEKKTSDKPTRTFKVESISLFSSIPKNILLIATVFSLVLVFILVIILFKKFKNRKKEKKGKKTNRPLRTFSLHS